MEQIGITERGDAALSTRWYNWVLSGKPAILITKNPKKLVEDFYRANKKSIFEYNIILHCTVTGLGGSEFEPGVPSFEETKGWLDHLDDHFYSAPNDLDKIVIRVDPIIPLRTQDAIDWIKYAVENYAFKRYRISFLDYYDHVAARLDKTSIGESLRKVYQSELHSPLSARKAVYTEIKGIVESNGASLEVCGEPGIPCTGCVSKKDCEILKVEIDTDEKGQRPYCACLANKFELLDNKHPCKHGCLYCYWKD